jgi:predicted enzyme related to lactoylglutathione lyase
MQTPPIVRKPAIVIDVSDLDRAAAFWGALLGVEPGAPRSDGNYLTVGLLADDVMLVLQKVPEPKVTKNRVHLDFTVDNVDNAVRKIHDFGGSQHTKRLVGGGVTMADPDGNEFCIGAFTRKPSGERVFV